MSILIEMYPKITSILKAATENFQHPAQHHLVPLSENLKYLLLSFQMTGFQKLCIIFQRKTFM
jgi:hypothetical protein